VLTAAEWVGRCGHCKTLAPEWKKAAKALAGSGDARVAAVDCDAHSELAQKYGIKGFPTIKVTTRTRAREREDERWYRQRACRLSATSSSDGEAGQPRARPAPPGAAK
jgi:thiol-disulfide isomerase/thioredoxin